METFEEDTRHILERNGLLELIASQDQGTSPLKENSSSGPKELANLERDHLLGQLSQKQKDELLKYFRVDFEMFDYEYRDLLPLDGN